MRKRILDVDKKGFLRDFIMHFGHDGLAYICPLCQTRTLVATFKDAEKQIDYIQKQWQIKLIESVFHYGTFYVAIRKLTHNPPDICEHQETRKQS
jgi:hypothetical protein